MVALVTLTIERSVMRGRRNSEQKDVASNLISSGLWFDLIDQLGSSVGVKGEL